MENQFKTPKQPDPLENKVKGLQERIDNRIISINAQQSKISVILVRSEKIMKRIEVLILDPDDQRIHLT